MRPAKRTRIPGYRSSIPDAAEERVTTRHSDGSKAMAEYLMDGKRVGTRSFDGAGNIEMECGWRDGLRHGTEYRFDEPGKLLSATPYSNGVEHGVASEWADDGRLLGTYRMRHGTGIDLWWGETWTKPRRRYLAEVHFMRRGLRHGYEWWLDEDQRTIFIERHWRDGEQHGIEREWNNKGHLRRGFPKYFVAGQQVNRRQYLKACATDPALPFFRSQENGPQREFPPEIRRHLGSAVRRRPHQGRRRLR
jgi:antitoxin component YwqK of YwqJK toxin-antitoxin module